MKKMEAEFNEEREQQRKAMHTIQRESKAVKLKRDLYYRELVDLQKVFDEQEEGIKKFKRERKQANDKVQDMGD